MASLTSTIDTTQAMVTYLYNHASWDSTVHIHATEIPANFTLRKAVLILPDGGETDYSLPRVNEGFSFWAYGTTMVEAKAVNDLIYDCMIKSPETSVTIDSGTVYINNIRRSLGPVPLREPDTDWPRWMTTYFAYFSDYAAT